MVGSEPSNCTYRKPDGEPCGATPMRDAEYCFWHSPQTATEAAEARRLGGLRRRREKVLEGTYELEGLESVGQLRRVLAIAALDLLSLENSVSRARALIAVVGTGAKLLEVGELEERVARLEAAVQSGGPN